MAEHGGPGVRKKGRSPSYPGIDLEAAITRARELWTEERQHPTPVETILSHWGYRSMTGNSAVTLAALKKFGLLAEEGSLDERRAWLTDLAFDILENPNEAERKAAIQKAALTPPIHRELWDRYQESGLPSDANLTWELRRQRGFTESGASDFVRQFRDTISFADLTNRATVETQPDDGGTDDGLNEPPPAAPQRALRTRGRAMNTTGEMVTYAVPLKPGADIVVEFPFAPSDEDWDFFVGMLNAVRPRLVVRRDRDDDSADPED